MLVVASEAAVLHDAGEGPFDDPAPRQNLEALDHRVPANDVQDDVSLVLCPSDEAPRIAAIGITTLHEGETRSRALQRAFAAVPVLDVGAMDMYGEQAVVGVGQDVALASTDFPAGVIAFRTPL